MPQSPTTLANGSQMKPAQLRTFHRTLATWYATNGRHDLPWRTTRDPYRIWLSEVMLQQTQVATVRDRFYGPFLAKFPSVEALAAAPREAVMKAWEGLGYYRRAGYLHEAAKQLMAAGGVPPPLRSLSLRGSPSATHQLYERWSGLPGIGRNTAHAILAFAYHQPVAILEANVKRMVARIFALEHPTDAQLWDGAETLLNRAEPFDYNQAMMDVGSLVCTPKHPDCGECPANNLCRGQGEPEIYPAPKAKKRVPVRETAILVMEDADGKLYLEQREAALLGGLYGFIHLPHAMPIASAASAIARGATCASAAIAGRVTHIYSHFRLEGTVHHLTITQSMRAKNWYTRQQIQRLPLSGVDHKVLTLVDHVAPALVDNSHTRRKK